jgi:peptidoglycan/xylan/chitin deacetylase (PgdA/CDA1 family)
MRLHGAPYREAPGKPAHDGKEEGLTMRLAAAAGAIAIVGCLAAGGMVLAQKSLFVASAPVPRAANVTPAPLAQPRVAVAAAEQAAKPRQPVTAPSAAAVISPAAEGVASSPAASDDGASPSTVAQAMPAQRKARATAPALVPAAAPAAAPEAAPAPAGAASSCANPNALGVSRIVEVDTTGGPGFGFEHFKTHDFLREGEVVLTFDDGPWPKNTPLVLAALAAHCTKAIFFPIGLHATYEPGILKEVAAAGHAIGSHTWCHQDLSKTKGKCQINGKTEAYEYDPKDEIEKGISAVHWALGGPSAPYFRFPALRQPPELVEYLGKRNIAMFSADFDSFDFKMRRPEQVRQSVMAKLKKHGKGIILMHDFQHATAEAAMDLLNDLKAGGYKVVFMKPKFAVTTIASYDELILKQMKGAGGGSDRPTSSVVRTISE